jgi:hypothetical protein
MKLNRKSLFVIFLALVMLFGLAACGTTASEADAGESDTAAEAPVVEESAEGGEIVPSFVFTNTGSTDICELYLSPASQEDWGVDQLAGNTIPAGQQFQLNNIPAGLYDAKAVGCDGSGEAIVQLDIQN